MADRWVKLNTNWMESDWLIVLGAEARLAWVQLICYTKTNGLAGRVKAKSAMVFARQNFIGEESVGQMILAAKANGALEEVDGDWILTGWVRHQGGDETAAERMRRMRNRKKSDDSVTDVTRNVTAEETRGDERRQDENKPSSSSFQPPNPVVVGLEVVEGGDPDPWEGQSVAQTVLATLKESEVFAASACKPSAIEQVILDHPEVPDDAWPVVARELRDQADGWGPAKRQAKAGNPKNPADSLRRYLADVVKPRLKGEKRRFDEGTPVSGRRVEEPEDAWVGVEVS